MLGSRRRWTIALVRAAKPWYLAFQRDNYDWRPFLHEKCLGGFASDLGVTPKIKGVIQAKRNACKPKVPVRERIGRSVPHPTASGRTRS